MHCPDRKGIVAMITDFIHTNGGNIVYLEQHVDTDHRQFFMRVEWQLEGFLIPRTKLADYFQTLIAERFDMTFRLYFSDQKPRMAIFVSKLSHCLYDLLARKSSGEWQVDIPLIISNHTDLQEVAVQFEVDFFHFPVTPENKAAQEQAQIELLQRYEINFMVFARYMQIVSTDFISRYPNRIINIHHSFLPAFPGARPYHSAHERGVKIIGATSHYVTSELDAGPIIDQDVAKVSHKESVADLIRKGKDIEKLVLSRAVRMHLQRRLLVFGNRTIVFD